jgi:hypothetical protein
MRSSTIQKKFSTEKKLFLWADGATASKKASLLVLLGRKENNSIDWNVLYVGYLEETLIAKILPKAYKNLEILENLNEISVVADNKCLNIFKSMKNNNNTRCSFCVTQFYYYFPQVNCKEKVECLNGCGPNCSCKKFYSSCKKKCSGACGCKCSSKNKNYRERKKHKINPSLFGIFPLLEFFKDGGCNSICRCLKCISSSEPHTIIQQKDTPVVLKEGINVIMLSDILHNIGGTIKEGINYERNQPKFNEKSYLSMIQKKFNCKSLYKGSQLREFLIGYDEFLLPFISTKRRKVAVNQLFSCLSLLTFLLYSKFDIKFKYQVKSFILLLLAKFNYILSVYYKDWKTGTGLLYFHILFYHISHHIIDDIPLHMINCELGESFFKSFKKIIKFLTGNVKIGQIKTYIERMYYKKKLNYLKEKEDNNYQKRKFIKSFKNKFEE